MSDLSAWAVDDSRASAPTLLSSIFHYRYWIAAAVLAALIVGFVVSSLLPSTYEAVGTIILSDSDAFGGTSVDPDRKVEQEANRLTSRAVFTRASETLNGELSPSALEDAVTVTTDVAVGLLEVAATAGTPEIAADAANAVIGGYEAEAMAATDARVEASNEVAQTQGARLREQIDELDAAVAADASDDGAARQLEALQAQLVALQTRISELAAETALYGSGIEAVEPAVAPSSPASPQPLRDAALVGILAFVAASGVAYWRVVASQDDKLDPSALLNAPLMARIPDFDHSGGTTVTDPLFDHEAAEAYQFLLSSFEYALAQTGARSVLITSASPGDGKSITSLHLARAFAIQGRNVMLVDSDIRARGLTSMLHAEGQPGLVSLADGESLDDVIRRYRISTSVQLTVVPSGRSPQNPTGLLSTPKYRQALSTVTELNELTIIDGGPLLTLADASAVAAQVDGLLLVLDASTSEEDLIKVQQRLRLIATPLLGIVLNRARDDALFAYPYEPSVSGGQRIRRFFGRRSGDTRDGTTTAPPVEANGHRR